jgi:hypothetical protein
MNTLCLAEETYIDEGKMFRPTPTRAEQAWSWLVTLSLLTMIKVLNTANTCTTGS